MTKLKTIHLPRSDHKETITDSSVSVSVFSEEHSISLNRQTVSKYGLNDCTFIQIT